MIWSPPVYEYEQPGSFRFEDYLNEKKAQQFLKSLALPRYRIDSAGKCTKTSDSFLKSSK